MDKRSSTRCPVCGGESAQPLGCKRVETRDYTVTRCPQCQLVYITEMPTPHALEEHYERAWHEEHAPTRCHDAATDHGIERLRFQRRLRELGRWTPPGRLLDVGCKDGAFLLLARAAGWQVAGLELSASAAATAQHHGLDVCVGTLDEAPYADGSFDVVTMWHLLEHVPQPLTLLRRVAHLLKLRGVLALETPNVEGRAFHRQGVAWEYLVPPEHLRFFGPHSLSLALQLTGYELLEQRFEGGTGVGPVLSQVGLQRLRRWALAHYRVVWPLKRAYLALCGRLAPSDDLMIVYARRSP